MKQILSLLVSLLLLSSTSLLAQLTLPSAPATTYTENFDGIGSGLPTGWTVRTGATATSLGTTATLATAATSWGTTTGNFRNCAAADNTGATATDNDATQASYTDRALAVRQTGGFGDPGAAFTLQIANTLGRSGFQLSFKSQMLSVQPRSTTWQVQYAFGSSPTTFTNVGSPITDPGVFGSTNITINFGSALNNQSGNVWIRIVALNASTGSGSRDTYGIDDFELTWSNSVPSASDGDGSATATNAGSGPLNGTALFRRNLGGQILQTVVTGVSAGDLETVEIDVPSDFTGLTASNVTTSGGGTPSVSVSGNTITVSGLALNNTNPLTVTASGLTTPTPASTDDGLRNVTVRTAVASGTPTPIASSPQVRVTVPMSSIRNALDANFLPAAPFATGTTVAVEGVASVASGNIGNFAGSSANRFQFAFRDATGGMIADNSSITFTPTVDAGDETVILGSINSFNGVTQLGLSSGNVFILGPAFVPLPSLQTIPNLTSAATAETLEGSLVSLENVFISSGTFPAAGSDGNVTISDGLNTMTMRIDDLTDIDGTPTLQGYFNVVGILGQADNSNPRDGNYQLYPRSLADFTFDNTESQVVNNTSVTFPATGVVLDATGAGNLGLVTITNSKGASGIVTVGISSGIASRWSINPVNQPTGSVTVTLSWFSAYDNGRNLSALQVWRSTDNGVTWTQVPGATFNTSTNPRTATFTVNGFSEFTITDTDNPLPVQLNSFTGVSTMRGVELSWNVASEQDNAGFIVFRDGQQIAHYNTTPELRGRGTTSEAKTYRYVDVSGLEVGRSYTYTLRSVDFDGTIHDINRSVVVQVSQTPTVAYTYRLEQNYPNPFNPSTNITFSIKDAGFVSLKVYDLLGREVATLVNERRAAGIYDVNFNASALGSGVYFYTLTSGGFSQTKKMLFVK